VGLRHARVLGLDVIKPTAVRDVVVIAELR
jgi:hypothetical protein